MDSIGRSGGYAGPMRTLLLCAVVFVLVALGYWVGFTQGRTAGRVESANGYRQAAQNGYVEGLADRR